MGLIRLIDKKKKTSGDDGNTIEAVNAYCSNHCNAAKSAQRKMQRAFPFENLLAKDLFFSWWDGHHCLRFSKNTVNKSLKRGKVKIIKGRLVPCKVGAVVRWKTLPGDKWPSTGKNAQNDMLLLVGRKKTFYREIIFLDQKRFGKQLRNLKCFQFHTLIKDLYALYIILILWPLMKYTTLWISLESLERIAKRIQMIEPWPRM